MHSRKKTFVEILNEFCEIYILKLTSSMYQPTTRCATYATVIHQDYMNSLV
jgi:hypothetical protein